MFKKMVVSMFIMAIVGGSVVLTLLLISETAVDAESFDRRIDKIEKEISNIVSEDNSKV